MAIRDDISATHAKRQIGIAVGNIETMFVGVITSVDPTSLKYGVQPVLNKYDKVIDKWVESPVLFECPMMSNKCGGFVIRMPYVVGDMVYVGVSKDSIDESIKSTTARENPMNGASQFRLIDGVILGGILSNEESKLSSDNTGDMLIQNRKTGCKIVMLSGGGINIETKSNVNVTCSKAKITSPETEITGNVMVGGNMTVTGNIVGGTMASAKGITLDGHTHKYNPGPGSPAPTQPGEG